MEMCRDNRIAPFPESPVGIALEQGPVITPGISFPVFSLAGTGHVARCQECKLGREYGDQQPAEPAVQEKSHDAASDVFRVDLVTVADMDSPAVNGQCGGGGINRCSQGRSEVTSEMEIVVSFEIHDVGSV